MQKSSKSSGKPRAPAASAQNFDPQQPPSFKNQDEMKSYVDQTRLALEKEIHKRLVEQLVLKVQNKSFTQEQQEHLERLYVDLKMINPELAFMTLKASGLVKSASSSNHKQSSSSKSKSKSSSKSHRSTSQKPSNGHY